MQSKINNPFNISFGEKPINFIPRSNEAERIINSFTSENPESKAFVLTGPRGSGKTVFLSEIRSTFSNKENWLAVNLNPYGDMLEQLCASIYEHGKTKHLFLTVDFNFSFKGLGFSIRGKEPVSNVQTLLEKMLTYLRKKDTKVLITVDDVTNNQNMKYFIHAYQSLIADKFNVFLLMTGLYENISEIENDKGLTFFIRAPKVHLDKLSLIAISNSYAKIFKIDLDNAIKLSKITMGYAYGYQLLGNLLFNNNIKLDSELLAEFDFALENNVYSLIWKTLSKKDKEILTFIAEGATTNEEIKKRTGLENPALQVYKSRLSKAGLIDTSLRGKCVLSLPRFKEYIQMQKKLAE